MTIADALKKGLDPMLADLAHSKAHPTPESASTTGVTLCVFSGELDKLLAAFTIANGAAACGMKVCMFFTFWGTTALRKPEGAAPGKGLVERMFGWMLPAGMHQLSLSHLNFSGLGRWLMLREMRKKGIPSLGDMIEMAKAAEVEILVCSMSMELMGLRPEELITYPNLRLCGATQFVDIAADSKLALFI